MTVQELKYLCICSDTQVWYCTSTIFNIHQPQLPSSGPIQTHQYSTKKVSGKLFKSKSSSKRTKYYRRCYNMNGSILGIQLKTSIPPINHSGHQKPAHYVDHMNFSHGALLRNECSLSSGQSSLWICVGWRNLAKTTLELCTSIQY